MMWPASYPERLCPQLRRPRLLAAPNGSSQTNAAGNNVSRTGADASTQLAPAARIRSG